MPKVTYFTATSLDWLFETPHGDDESSWERLMAESAALVMGGTTYRWMIDHDPEMLTGPGKWREYHDEIAATVDGGIWLVALKAPAAARPRGHAPTKVGHIRATRS